VTGADRDFKFGIQAGYSKSQSADKKIVPEKGHGQGHVTHFKILHPMEYLWNGYSYRLQFLPRDATHLRY